MISKPKKLDQLFQKNPKKPKLEAMRRRDGKATVAAELKQWQVRSNAGLIVAL